MGMDAEEAISNKYKGLTLKMKQLRHRGVIDF